MKVDKKLVDAVIIATREHYKDINATTIHANTISLMEAQSKLNDKTEDDIANLISDIARFTLYLDEPFDLIYKMIDVLGYEVEGEWKPKEGEMYYAPNFEIAAKHYFRIWNDVVKDELLFDNGLVFRTKEEAIAMAEKMLAVAKEERE